MAQALPPAAPALMPALVWRAARATGFHPLLCAVPTALLLLISVAIAPAQTPSFASDIAPLFRARCAGCHAADVKMGTLDTDSYEGLRNGGNNGPVFVPGKSAESRLYLMLAGKVTPPMPMDGTQLPPAQIEMVKRWIDAGAPGPTPEEAAALRKAREQARIPQVKARGQVKPRIFDLAWHPDGSLLALAGYREVKLVNPRDRRPVALLTGHVEAVRAVAISKDGKRLAAAGGIPGARGQVKLWDLDTRVEAATIDGHDDVIYCVAFSPDRKWLATGSYDKLIKLWDTATGKEVRTLKDHIDAVYALAFTPDGRRLISGAADRTVKVWDPATGKRLYTLSEPLEGINTVAIDPAGKLVAAAGADKSIRVWSLGENSGELLHSQIAHEDAILKLAWSPDGSTLVSSSADRTVKLLDSTSLAEKRTLSAQPDWAYAVGFSPDGNLLAIGRLDGSFDLAPASTRAAAQGR